MVRIQLPAPALQPFVRFYAHVDERVGTLPIVQPIAARWSHVIEFTFGTPYQVQRADVVRAAKAHSVVVVGAQTYRRVLLKMQGHVVTFVVAFQPGGFFRLFSMPVDALTNQDLDGVAVLGNSMDELRARLGDSMSFAERVGVADGYLLRRLHGRRFATGVSAAAAELLRCRGSLPVAELAERSGLSVRQLERRFVVEIGLTPKLFARVARYEGALQRKRQSPETRWTDVAHELGYHDQPHMVRDFLELSGSTPSDVAHDIVMQAEHELDSTDSLQLSPATS
jgi:AraC-like DNA-binding protein